MQKRLFFLFSLHLFTAHFFYGAAQAEYYAQLSQITFSDEPSIFSFPSEHFYTPQSSQEEEDDFDSSNSMDLEDLKIIIAKIKELMRRGSEDEVLAKTGMYRSMGPKLSLMHHVKHTIIKRGIDTDALGPLLVGAGPRLTSLLLSQGADPYTAHYLAIRATADGLVKEKLERKMQLLAEKLDPLVYAQQWKNYLQWKISVYGDSLEDESVKQID